MPRFFAGNQVELLRSGCEYFPAIIAAIDSAQREVYLETYIYSDDATGELVTQALVRAAERGLEVRVTVDGFGSGNLAPSIRKRFEEAFVELVVFRPERKFLSRGWNLSRQRMRRLHRKLVMVDRMVAFVGGINILDDHLDNNGHALEFPRYDFAVRIVGPLVGLISLSVLHQWQRLNWQELKSDDVHFGHAVMQWWTHGDWKAPSAGGGRVDAGFIPRDNFRNRTAIERAYLKAIGHARRDIIIASAYFFPGRRFRRALRHATGRGVRVRLLLQGRVEYPLQHRASQWLYDDLLRDGIEIYEYQPSLLHAKVAVVDDLWATVGSSNLDPFSLLLAREANVIVRDRGFSATLREELVRAIEHDSQPIAPHHVSSRSWFKRTYHWFAYGMLRFGVLLTGRAEKY